MNICITGSNEFANPSDVVKTIVPPPERWSEELAEIRPNHDTDAKERIAGYLSVLDSTPQIELPLRHTFLPGVYIREMFIRAGDTLVGAVHKDEHMFILHQGVLAIYSEHGKGTIRGPFRMLSKPGAQRVGWALTDCYLMSVHPTHYTTVEEVEANLWVRTYEEYQCYLKSLKEQNDA